MIAGIGHIDAVLSINAQAFGPVEFAGSIAGMPEAVHEMNGHCGRVRAGSGFRFTKGRLKKGGGTARPRSLRIISLPRRGRAVPAPFRGLLKSAFRSIGDRRVLI